MNRSSCRGLLLASLVAHGCWAWLAVPEAAADSIRRLAIDPTGSRLYSSRMWKDNVLVVDRATLAPAGVIRAGSLSHGNFPRGLAFAGAEKRLYVTNQRDNSVSVADLARGTTLAVIQVGEGPSPLIANASGSRVYVAAQEGHSIAVIDTRTNAVSATIKVPHEPDAMMFDPAETRLYVASGGAALSVIDLATNSVVAGIASHADRSFRRADLGLEPTGKRLYLTSEAEDTIVVVDTSRLAVVADIEVGRQPQGLAVDAARHRVFVANAGDGTVSIVDTAKLAVVATIRVGGSPCEIIVAPSGRRIYVASARADESPARGAADLLDAAVDPANRLGEGTEQQDGAAISIIDGERLKIAARIPLSFEPQGMLLDSSGRRLFVRESMNGSIRAIDTVTAQIVATVAGQVPRAIALDAAGHFAFVANWGTGTVTVLDTARATKVAMVQVGGHPTDVAASPIGARAFVTDSSGGEVAVIDTAARRVVHRVKVGQNPVALAVDPAGQHLYVVNELGNDVSQIDIATARVATTIPVGKEPTGIAINPRGTRVYVANQRGRSVSVIDTATRRVIATIRLPQGPQRVAVSSDGRRIFASCFGEMLVAIDSATNKVVATLSVDGGPALGLVAAGNRLFMSHFYSNVPCVSVIDTARWRVSTCPPVGRGPVGIAVDLAGRRAYVANSTDDTISVLDTAAGAAVGTIRE